MVEPSVLQDIVSLDSSQDSHEQTTSETILMVLHILRCTMPGFIDQGVKWTICHKIGAIQTFSYLIHIYLSTEKDGHHTSENPFCPSLLMHVWSDLNKGYTQVGRGDSEDRRLQCEELKVGWVRAQGASRTMDQDAITVVVLLLEQKQI